MLTNTLKALRSYFSAEARMGRVIAETDMLVDGTYDSPPCFSEDELIDHCSQLAEDYGHNPKVVEKLLFVLERAADYGTVPHLHAREMALTIADSAASRRSEESLNASIRGDQNLMPYTTEIGTDAQSTCTGDDVREALEKAAIWVWRDVFLSDFEAEFEAAGTNDLLKGAIMLRYRAECSTLVFNQESYWARVCASETGKMLEPDFEIESPTPHYQRLEL